MGNGGCGGAHPPIFQEVKGVALRVWLPLISDLHNQGCSNVNITAQSGVMLQTNGKIGSCYTSDGSTNGTANNFNITLSHFTIATWLRINTRVNGWKCPFKLFNNSSAAARQYIGIGCEHTNGTSIGFHFYKKIGDTNTKIFDKYITPPATGTWMHLAVTYNGLIARYYLNGIEVTTETIATAVQNTSAEIKTLAMFGANGDYAVSTTKTSLNDVRIYDHCLSAAEVKEISQGLVLHYKLDSFQGGFGNPNLVAGSNTTSTSTNRWGASSAVGGNTSTIVQDENGHTCVQVARDATAQSSWDYLYYSNLLRNLIKTDTTYTVSFDCKPSVDGSISFTGFLNGNATNYMTSSTSTIQGTCHANQWNHMVYRCTTKASFSDISVSGQVVYFSRSGSLRGVNTTVLFKNIKVEEGTIDTPWCPADSELTIDRTHIQDSSGYGRNGTVNGSLSLSSNTPRYDASIQFSANNYITHPALFTMYQATYSFWVKEPSFTTYGAIYQPKGNPSTGTAPWFSANTESASVWTYFGGNSPNYTKGSGTLNTNTWYHCAYVWNNGIAQWYLNGTPSGNSVTYTGKTYIQNTAECTLGDSYTGSSWNGTPFNGQLSDFRIYATALSADDILSLYHTAAKVDNLGGLHTFEFQEKGPNKIYKTGITQGQEISEIDGMSNLKYDPNVYIEPDGSAWVRIFHHANPTSNKFASSDTFTTGVYKDENRWFNFDLCNNVNTWEFMLIQKAESTTTTETKYRWIQTKNPLVAVYADVASANIIKITTSGYTTFSHGGLYKINSNTYLCTNNGANGNWWGAVGAWNAHGGGIPAWASVVVKTGYVDVYLRIDNITTTMPTIAKSTKNNIWIGHTLIEK